MVERNLSDPLVSLKDQKITTLFIGNPGAGKSTLLNGLIRKVIFKSGISLGTGLTSTLQVYTDDVGNQFFDTPGLSDEQKRKQAAAEIEKALRKGGVYRIFFVFTVESGRIKPDDKATIKLVLEAAAQIKTNCFSMIVNKVSPKFCQKMKEEVEDFTTMRTLLNANLPAQTDKIFYNVNDPDLVDAENQLPSLSAEFSQFVRTASEIEITEDQVKQIEWNQFEKMQKDLAQKTAEIENNKKLLDQLKIDQEKQFEANKKEKEDLERRFQELLTLSAENEKRLIEAERKNVEAEKARLALIDALNRERRVAEETKATEANIAGLKAQIRESEKKAEQVKLEATLKDLDRDHEIHVEYLVWHEKAIRKSATWKDGNGKRHKHSDGIVGQKKYLAENRKKYKEILNRLASL